ncbi:hypothetical protein X736_29515 [Mesorhizobium sp. L2C089B000]|nr:hypothetical protein X736_29515 [Mesorhizobium sp. L2C089B000]
MEVIAPELQEAVGIMLFASSARVFNTAFVSRYVSHYVSQTARKRNLGEPFSPKFANEFKYLFGGSVVPLAGIEPATSGSTIRRSNHLSYNGTFA